MSGGLEALASMEYPGRFIAIGSNVADGIDVVVYGITGRSPSSQARKLVLTRGKPFIMINTEPTDRELLKQGNTDLLVYPAIILGPSGIAVSNGRQTNNIYHNEKLCSSLEVLANGLRNFSYEPDSPNYTPRISGRIEDGYGAALSIIKCDNNPNGSALRAFFDLASIGKLITTYKGPNTDPLPSFEGEPLSVRLESETAEDTAGLFYHSLSPKEGKDDLRVSVAAVHYNHESSKASISIFNRSDKRTKNYSLVV